jgi:hypothetical protein
MGLAVVVLCRGLLMPFGARDMCGWWCCMGCCMVGTPMSMQGSCRQVCHVVLGGRMVGGALHCEMGCCIVGTSISSVLQPGWASRALCSIRGLLVWMVRQCSLDCLQSHWCVTPADGRVSLTEAGK